MPTKIPFKTFNGNFSKSSIINMINMQNINYGASKFCKFKFQLNKSFNFKSINYYQEF